MGNGQLGMRDIAGVNGFELIVTHLLNRRRLDRDEELVEEERRSE